MTDALDVADPQPQASRVLSGRQEGKRTEGVETRRVIVNEFLSLDAVAQAPGGADEDTSGGFAHGWYLQHVDEVSHLELLEERRFADGVVPVHYRVGS